MIKKMLRVSCLHIPAPLTSRPYGVIVMPIEMSAKVITMPQRRNVYNLRRFVIQVKSGQVNLLCADYAK